MEKEKEKILNRINSFYKNDFFENRKGLPEALVDFELRIEKNLPNTFEIRFQPEYYIGENEVTIGRIHVYYVFGLKKENQDYQYLIFENKSSIRLFFTSMKNLQKEDLAFWLKQINEI